MTSKVKRLLWDLGRGDLERQLEAASSGLVAYLQLHEAPQQVHLTAADQHASSREVLRHRRETQIEQYGTAGADDEEKR